MTEIELRIPGRPAPNLVTVRVGYCSQERSQPRRSYVPTTRENLSTIMAVVLVEIWKRGLFCDYK